MEQLRAELARSEQRVADMAAAHQEFLRAVSHDLRAPLRHFTSYGTLVRETLADLPPPVATGAEVQEALGFLATMDHSARRMGLMVDGLQALAHASHAPLRLQPVPLADALARARSALAQAEAGRGVDWSIAPDLPTLQADPALLHELLVQLLGNALKFTRGSTRVPCIAVQASGTVDVDAGNASAAGGGGVPVQTAAQRHVAFTVTDNGAGFDNARAAQLFGVFQRLHRESEFDGVGAGLALCRAIAQRHGATITATAAVGAGCTVRVQWPGT
ncbi:MAG: two-component sensor histidine kinase [Comamonadaceae bacterium]|nr:MAG: two-component sensor histidine kinase [Comamonadaceae bacterium]